MLPNDLIDRFTAHLKDTLQKALSYAVTNGRELVEPGDLIVGILHERGSLGGEILKKAECTPENASDFFRGKPSQKPASVMALDLTDKVKKVLEKAIVTAHLHEHKYVGTEHLLYAILEHDDARVQEYLKKQKVDIKRLKEQLDMVFRSETNFPSLDQMAERSHLSPLDNTDLFNDEMPMPPMPGGDKKRSQQTIESFARNLTDKDEVKKLDPVIGRERELNRVIEILIRRTKSNPVLLGEPGVGKTAVVEGLAQRLATGDVPDALSGCKVLSLDLASTVAGTMYRGEFEARLKQIVEEAQKDPRIILFIDEIHNIVGAGSTSGTLDAANILKPALARGEIRCIGATTWSEYKKHIEPDAALERRFQPITVEEPTAEDTLKMIQGLEPHYAKHHRVKYQPGALTAAVTLAERFITDRKFPDKAVDLLDEAAASVVARQKNPEQRERLSVLDAAIQSTLEDSEKFLRDNNLDEASKSAAQATDLSKQREDLKNELDDLRDKHQVAVTAEDVARVVARTANVDIQIILASERERLSDLGDRLARYVIGQDAAIKATAEVVRKARMGLQNELRPKASLLYVGPSGTGKTLLARALAKELFNREDALIKLDMSEFAEPHSISKLVGSPAGYVGYRESNKLTDAVRQKPHAVVCFDEIEKAHPDVQHTLLQILEDGQMSDATGRTVSFRQAYIILTSNVGSDQLGRKLVGFDSQNASLDPVIHQELKNRFKPELLNRLDRIAIFEPLKSEHLEEILEREISEVCARLKKVQRVACMVADEARDWLMKQPMNSEEGARAIRRLVEREITAAIGQALSSRQSKRKITITANKGGIVVK